MLINNPVFETETEIEKKYGGYCVLVVRCSGDIYNYEGGEVVAFNKNLAALTSESEQIFNNDENVGVFVFKTYTGFGGSAVLQVIHHGA
jgi:hypothetical protein